MPIIEIECLRCHKKFDSKLYRNRENNKKEFRQVFCSSCRKTMGRAKDIGRKERVNVRLISDRVNYAHEVEALRRMEVSNPRLVERLRRESAEKAKEAQV